MVITEIWRYPVKSMGGDPLTSARITELGIDHDRGWGVFDPETQKVLTGRREPRLLLASASVSDGNLSITTDRQTTIDGDLATMSEALSSWLGYKVELRQAGDTGGTYEVPIDIDTEQDWIEWTGPGGAWHDSTRTRISILSTASTNGIDPRRFRANIITDGDARQEEAWVGSELQIGPTDSGVRLQVTKQIDRCVMVARPQYDLAADVEALRWVIRERSNQMGVGTLVAKAGRCAVGDEVMPAQS